MEKPTQIRERKKADFKKLTIPDQVYAAQVYMNILIFIPLYCITIIINIILIQSQASPDNRNYKDGFCMTYGRCGTDTQSGKPIPCYYNGPAFPLTDKGGLKILAELCPWMVAEKGETTYTCCDQAGLNTLLNNVQPAQQTLDRCPSCYRNFLNLLCSTTCSPNQSVFMNVTETAPYTPAADAAVGEPFQGNLSVIAVDVYVEGAFANGMYNACKNVNFPSTNQKVMSLYCGSYGAAHCSAQRWLDFIGSKSNGQTPFAFNYHLRNDSTPEPLVFVPLNLTVHPCNEGVGNTSTPCSCQDCPKACPPVIPPPTPPAPCIIWFVDCFTFYIFVSWVVFVLIFTLLDVLHSLLSSNPGHEKGKFNVGCQEAIGEFIDRSLRRMFHRLGLFVATNPFPVIFVSIVAVIGMACGMFMLTVSSPH